MCRLYGVSAVYLFSSKIQSLRQCYWHVLGNRRRVYCTLALLCIPCVLLGLDASIEFRGYIRMESIVSFWQAKWQHVFLEDHLSPLPEMCQADCGSKETVWPTHTMDTPLATGSWSIITSGYIDFRIHGRYPHFTCSDDHDGRHTKLGPFSIHSSRSCLCPLLSLVIAGVLMEKAAHIQARS